MSDYLINLVKSPLSHQKLDYKVYRIDYNRVSQKIDIDGLENKEFPLYQFSKLLKQFYNSEARFNKEQAFKAKPENIFKYAFEKIKTNRLYIIFSETGDIACHALIEPVIDGDTYQVNLLCTDNNYKHQGFALNMLKFAENLAISDNKDRLSISVYSQNDNALNLYKKFGFREVGYSDMSERKQAWSFNLQNSMKEGLSPRTLIGKTNKKFSEKYGNSLKDYSKRWSEVNNSIKSEIDFDENPSLGALLANKLSCKTDFDTSAIFDPKKSRKGHDRRMLKAGALGGGLLGIYAGGLLGALEGSPDSMLMGSLVGLPVGALAGLGITGNYNVLDRRRERKLIKNFRSQAKSGARAQDIMVPYDTKAASAWYPGAASQDRVKQLKQYAYDTKDMSEKEKALRNKSRVKRTLGALAGTALLTGGIIAAQHLGKLPEIMDIRNAGDILNKSQELADSTQGKLGGSLFKLGNDALNKYAENQGVNTELSKLTSKTFNTIDSLQGKKLAMVAGGFGAANYGLGRLKDEGKIADKALRKA